LSLFGELKRRGVVKVAIAYVIVAWVLLQVSENLVPALHLPEWFHSGVAFLLILGFPIAMLFAWAFEMTPEGLKSEESVEKDPSTALFTKSKSNYLMFTAMAIALAYFAYDKFFLSSSLDAESIEATSQIAQEQAPVEPDINEVTERSIAVLPFVNMSDDPGNEFFADGISEELLNLLAGIPRLRVTSRSSAFSFKGKDINVPLIAEQLNVAHILEGSVRKSGNRVRITSQLIEAASDTHLWSETYDRSLDDIFAIQDEVAAEVVKQLRITLLNEQPHAEKVNPQAYALLLQARQLYLLNNDQDLLRAEALLTQALAIDADYLDALILMAEVASDETVAEEFHKRVLELDPDNATMKSARAMDLSAQGVDIATVARLQEEAAATEPHNSIVIFNSARIANELGKMDLAINLSEYVAVRDPLFFWARLNLASNYFQVGRIEDALEQFEVALSLNSSEGVVRWKYGLALLVAGRPEAAIEQFELEDGWVYTLHGLALAYHSLRRDQESLEAMEKLLPTEVEAWPYGLARAYAWMGDADQAFYYLEDTVNRLGRTPGGFATNPLLTKLHSDPRWQPFLESVGQTPEQIAAVEFNVSVPD
jgi:adenylate cyclase